MDRRKSLPHRTILTTDIGRVSARLGKGTWKLFLRRTIDSKAGFGIEGAP